MDEIVRLNGSGYRIEHDGMLFTEETMRQHLHGNGHVHEYVRFTFVAYGMEDYNELKGLAARMEQEQWTRARARTR